MTVFFLSTNANCFMFSLDQLTFFFRTTNNKISMNISNMMTTHHFIIWCFLQLNIQDYNTFELGGFQLFCWWYEDFQQFLFVSFSLKHQIFLSFLIDYLVLFLLFCVVLCFMFVLFYLYDIILPQSSFSSSLSAIFEL